MAEARVRDRFTPTGTPKGRPGRKSLFINKDKAKAMRFTPACLAALDAARFAKGTSRADYLEKVFWKDEARQTASVQKLSKIYVRLFGRVPNSTEADWLKDMIANA